jgi:pimeloyl-ACP methyl ester carboxylesterase
VAALAALRNPGLQTESYRVNVIRRTVSVIVTSVVAGATLVAGPRPVVGQTHMAVTVGDHALDVVTSGHGSPAIVFETGLADSLDVWLPMWRAMAQFTTVIAYSRAGFGRSGAGSSDHSVPSAVADLHALLQHVGVSGPYILVARSYGSLIARTYVSRYPADVVGLVPPRVSSVL